MTLPDTLTIRLRPLATAFEEARRRRSTVRALHDVALAIIRSPDLDQSPGERGRVLRTLTGSLHVPADRSPPSARTAMAQAKARNERRRQDAAIRQTTGGYKWLIETLMEWPDAAQAMLALARRAHLDTGRFASVDPDVARRMLETIENRCYSPTTLTSHQSVARALQSSLRKHVVFGRKTTITRMNFVHGFDLAVFEPPETPPALTFYGWVTPTMAVHLSVTPDVDGDLGGAPREKAFHYVVATMRARNEYRMLRNYSVVPRFELHPEWTRTGASAPGSEDTSHA